MAEINNFSLVGVGQTVKFGKGGVTVATSGNDIVLTPKVGGVAKIGANAIATETYVTTRNYLTDATAATAGYLKIADINALNYIDTTELGAALADYTLTADLESTVTGYGFLKQTDIDALNYVDDTELASALADYTLTADLDSTIDGYGYLKSADLTGYLQTTDIGVSVQGHDADLDAIAALAGTSGFLKKTAANTWSLDTATYLTTGDAAATYATLTNLSDGLALKLDLAGGTLTGPLILAGNPDNALEAATKQYVDGVAAGLSFKQSVIVATTANIALDGSVTTIDGVTLTGGMRVLVKNQTDATENGIYDAIIGDPWSRSSDADEPGEIKGGTFVFVTSGTSQADTGYVVVAPDGSAVIGTDPIAWTQYSSTGTVSVVAGTGIDVSNTLGAYTVSLADIAADNGTFGSASETLVLTIDTYGRVGTAVSTAIEIDWAAIVSGKPTTLAGYGITNGVSTTTNFGGDVSGTYNAITLATVGTPVTAAFVKFTTDTKGRVTATTAVTASDIETALGFTPADVASLANVATSGLASDVSYTPTGAIAATDVQAALTELDSEKLALAGGTMTGALTLSGAPTVDLHAATKKYVDDTLAAAVSGGSFTVKAAFTGDTVASLLAGMPANSVITRITVKVATAFTGGTAPIITVSQDGNVVEDGSGSDLESTGIYIIDSFTAATQDDSSALEFAVTGGATGVATVFVEYSL